MAQQGRKAAGKAEEKLERINRHRNRLESHGFASRPHDRFAFFDLLESSRGLPPHHSSTSSLGHERAGVKNVVPREARQAAFGKPPLTNHPVERPQWRSAIRKTGTRELVPPYFSDKAWKSPARAAHPSKLLLLALSLRSFSLMQVCRSAKRHADARARTWTILTITRLRRAGSAGALFAALLLG